MYDSLNQSADDVQQWRVRELTQFAGFGLEWVSADGVVLSRRQLVYAAPNFDSQPRLITEIPTPWWKRAKARSRLLQRAMRFMIFNVLPLDPHRWLVTFNKQIGVVDRGHFRSLAGLRRPARVLRGGVAVASSGDAYFGEYLLNKSRHEISIYRYSLGASSVEPVYVFPRGSIAHVHGVYRDPFTDDLWCTVGDFPHESRILRTDDAFRHVDVVGAGDESWRCVSLQFTANAVYYGTDAQFVQNRIFRLDRRSGRRDTVCHVGGPVFYSRRIGDQMLFGVTAEACPSQPVVAAEIWSVDDQDTARCIWSAGKDRYHKTLFMLGVVHFALGPVSKSHAWFHGVGLHGADNRVFEIRAPQANAHIAWPAAA